MTRSCSILVTFLLLSGLNIFLRDCLYTVYLRERYRLN